MKLNDTVGPNDFLIRITPNMDGGAWDNTVDLTCITSEDCTLTEEEFTGIANMTSMLAATMVLLETDEYIRDTVFDYVMEMDKDFAEEDVDEGKSVEFKAVGNVIHHDFTITKGNA